MDDKYIDIDKVKIKLPICKDFGEMLEKGITMERWENKKRDRITQVEYILDYVYNNDKDKKTISILKDYFKIDNISVVSSGTMALQIAIKSLNLKKKIITKKS